MFQLSSLLSPSGFAMGGSSGVLPYCVGIIIGHLGTIAGWIITAFVDTYLDHPTTKLTTGFTFRQTTGFPSTSHPYSTSTATTTLTVSTVGGVWRGNFKGEGSSGGLICVLALIAITSWLLGGLVTYWWCQRSRSSEICEVVSPSLRDLARSQLAEVRLRRHGIGQQGGSP